MKNNKFFSKILPLIFVFGVGMPFLSSCSGGNAFSGGSQTLRILNWEDYIYENDPLNGYDEEDLTDQFIEYVKENYPQYKNVNVVYDTTDTNETMYNEIKTGKSQYDLICPSDYMIQKMLSADMLEKLDRNLIPNYENYASSHIKNILDSISAHNNVTGTDEYLKDYAVGYMWGTLGILFNPTYSKLNVSEEQIISDTQSWTVLWSKDYKGTISVKDSMRDTYAAGLMYTYDDELTALREEYLSDVIDESTYNERLTEIFNRCEKEQVNAVEKSLNELKKNIFGLEVDSGKEDIVTGKIGINLAWSGDAVYSMDQAEDEELVSTPHELCYAVPENGGNIWFDGWVMPKLSEDNPRSQAQYELAHIFLNFISDPANASQNMNYIGYTSFIAGDAILELVRDWYDYRTDLLWYDEENDDYYDNVYYIDPLTNETVDADYSDVHFASESDSAYDSVELFGVYEGEEEVVIGTYNDRFILPDDIEEVDLTYFFAGTLDEYEDGVDTIFYSDCYLPFYNEDGTQNICVGRQFFTQYPNYETIVRCAVMEDYKENNQYILTMWENFKSDPLPTWAIILFVLEIIVIGGTTIFFIARRKISKSRRIKRKQN